MKRPYQLIALDIDGTLLSDEYKISKRTIDVIQEAHAEGTMIVLCTGRGPANTLPIMSMLDVDGYMITHNGAVHLNSKGEIVLQNTFLLDEVRALIDDCRGENVHFDVNTAFDLYIERVTPLADEMYVDFNVDPIMVEDVSKLTQPMVKLCVFGETEEVDHMESRWKSLDWSQFGHIHMIRSGEEFIDVMDINASKGSALLQFAAKYGIGPEGIMAIGNYYNDIDMLEVAGFSVAVDNSPDRVKAAADVVTASNNNEGVYHAIQKYHFQRASEEHQTSETIITN